MASREYYMLEALKEAKKAYKKKEMPIGCVVVYNDKIIAKAHNMRCLLYTSDAADEL